jgi:CheY-like chemotaxis protein
MVSILLVEDNEMNRDLMVLRLSRSGFEVETAVNGLEAVEKCAGTPFDLVLMDLNLPELDGWEAIRRIRRQEQGLRTPIIALTASATVEDRDRAIAAGCDAFEAKPVHMPKLLDRIHALLGGGDHG